MEAISINELLPSKRRIRQIKSGSELLLAYELDKYSRLMLNRQLRLTDVSIAKELLLSEHFSFVVMNGLDVGVKTSRENLVDYSKNERFFFKDTVEGVAFVEFTDEKVVYNHPHDVNANRVLYGDNRASAYVSLVAYLIVKAKSEGKDIPFLVIDHENYNQQELEYADLFVLKNYGNRIIEGLIDIKYSTAWGLQPEWEAFVIYNRQRGLMNGEYTTTEKFRHLKRNFEVGDVVLLYNRTKGARGKTINQLKSCYPAVIKSFDENSIKLVYYPIVQTRLTRHILLDDIMDDFEEAGRDPIYTAEDYERFYGFTETFDYTELGVDTCTYLEQTFFIKPHDFDGTHQYLKVDGVTYNLFMSTLDTIYAVFEDRGVEYNKEKFLDLYFRSAKRIPKYDQYVTKEEVQ